MHLTIKNYIFLFLLLLTNSCFAAETERPHIDFQKYFPNVSIGFGYTEAAYLDYQQHFDLLKERVQEAETKYKIIFKNVEQQLLEVSKLPQDDPKHIIALEFMDLLIEEISFRNRLQQGADVRAAVTDKTEQENIAYWVNWFEKEHEQDIKKRFAAQQQFLQGLYIPGQATSNQDRSYDELFDQLRTQFSAEQGEVRQRAKALHSKLTMISRDLIESDQQLHDLAVAEIRMELDRCELKNRKEMLERSLLWAQKNNDLEYEASVNQSQEYLDMMQSEIEKQLPVVAVNLEREHLAALARVQKELQQQESSKSQGSEEVLHSVGNRSVPVVNPQKTTFVKNEPLKDKKTEYLKNHQLLKRIGCGVGSFGVISYYIHTKNKQALLQLRNLQILDQLTEQQKMELEKLKSLVYRYKPKTVKDVVCLVGAMILVGTGFMV